MAEDPPRADSEPEFGGFFALLFYAAFRLPCGVAATLGAVQPLIAVGLAAALLGEKVRRVTIVVGSLGVIGVALLVLRSDAQLDSLGILAGLAGAVSMAVGVVLTKRWGRPVPLLTFTSWQLIAGGLVLLPLTIGIEGLPTIVTTSNLAGFLWLATFGTAIAYSLWFRGVQLLPVAQVSILGLLSPLVAALAGWTLLDQHSASANSAEPSSSSAPSGSHKPASSMKATAAGR